MKLLHLKLVRNKPLAILLFSYIIINHYHFYAIFKILLLWFYFHINQYFKTTTYDINYIILSNFGLHDQLPTTCTDFNNNIIYTKRINFKKKRDKIKKKEMVHSSSVHLNEFCHKTLTAQHLIATNAYIGKIVIEL